MESATLFQVDAEPGQASAPVNSIISQSILQNSDVKVVRFVFAEGQELSEHTATVAAMIVQISGECDWVLGEERHHAKPGDWAYMPANLKHSLHAREDSSVLLLLLKKTGVNA